MNTKCCSLSFLITFSWRPILFDIRMATPFTSSDHLLGKLFSSLSLWGNVCLCLWGVFPVGSRMQDPHCVSSLLICVFLLGSWDHWCWEILRTSYCFLLYSYLDARLCLCTSLCFVAKMISFLLFLGCSLPPYVGLYHLLSVVGLDL